VSDSERGEGDSGRAEPIASAGWSGFRVAVALNEEAIVANLK
jgi:hypothetical protein